MDTEKNKYDNEIKDITESEIGSGTIHNVLLLNMSTLNPNIKFFTKNTYIFEERTYYGYGQLEPVPQILNNYILPKDGKTLDLIIITASKETQDEQTFHLDNEDSPEYTMSAVSFFKRQIQEECGNQIKFLTIPIDDTITALYNTTNVIRKIKSFSKSDFHLYMDIHGGLRDVQLLFDAIMTTLSIEGIYVKEAYTCEHRGKDLPSIIKTVTNELQMFRFVSGINEFINYGSAKELSSYLKNCQKYEQTDSSWRSKLIANINDISESLSLCKINAFEHSLDSLNETINEDHPNDDLFEIFISNIQNDYGDLLDSKKRTLHSLVAWALKKGFYQQALAIIEAKTPEFVFLHFLDVNSLDISENNVSLKDNPPKKKWGENEAYYLSSMCYSHKKDQSPKKNHYPEKNLDHFTYDNHKRYILWSYADYHKNNPPKYYKLKCKTKYSFDDSSLESLDKLVDKWWYIKKKLRNPMFHVSSDPTKLNNVTINNVSKNIKDYLELLNELLPKNI